MNKKKAQINIDSVILPLVLVGMMWVVFVVQQLGFLNGCYGVIAWQTDGLRGIILSPMFHGSLEHIISNSIPLLILTFALFFFYKKQAYLVLIVGWLISGLGLWLLPDFGYIQSNIHSCHIGASGIIYMIAFFLFFSGMFSRRFLLLIVSIVVFFIYGSIVYGILPNQVDYGVSWQGHLMGAITGLVLAYQLNKKN